MKSPLPTSFDGTICDEAWFARILSSERKRTDRSGRPFLLLLLELKTLPRGRPQRRALDKNVMRALQSCIRQTDTMGWYKHHTTIGIIFTEWYPEKPPIEKMCEKVRAALEARLTPEQINAIVLSVHVYPHPSDRVPDASAKDVLYPDLTQRKAGYFFKRAVDIVGSLGFLVLFSPVLILVGLAVKCTSKGPILFKQTRIGQFGQPFTLWKFRSMYIDADSKMHEQYVKDFIGWKKNSTSVPDAVKQDGLFKMSRDPRVTPLGRFIRKTSLDEFPQLLNVLLGTMSLVGPRPPLSYEVERYDTWHLRRVLDARPGITGLWQVQGRSRTTFDDMVRLDLRYLNDWSIWADIKILFQTPWAVLKCEGAR